jgi:hypothetical protein
MIHKIEPVSRAAGNAWTRQQSAAKNAAGGERASYSAAKINMKQNLTKNAKGPAKSTSLAGVSSSHPDYFRFTEDQKLIGFSDPPQKNGTLTPPITRSWCNASRCRTPMQKNVAGDENRYQVTGTIFAGIIAACITAVSSCLQ